MRTAVTRTLAGLALVASLAACQGRGPGREVETSDLLRRHPVPAQCQTEQEGTLRVWEDGSALIVETGCRLDAETGVWSR